MDAVACRRQAMDLLARREHSRLELERKLMTRAYAEDIVAEVLDRLVAERLIDEARFAESFVRSRVARGQGPARIRKDLADRGVSGAHSEDALAAVESDWRVLASKVREKRFGSEQPRDYKERARQARFLQYRGFSMDQIKSALDLEPGYD